jgi:hypothetical protein
MMLCLSQSWAFGVVVYGDGSSVNDLGDGNVMGTYGSSFGLEGGDAGSVVSEATLK